MDYRLLYPKVARSFSLTRVLAILIVATGSILSSTNAVAAVRQFASARTPNAHCLTSPGGIVGCDPLPQSLTITFDYSTLAGSKLILLAQWTIVDLRGSIAGCTDNLGQNWEFDNGESVLIWPPTTGTSAGITSITCQTDFPNPPIEYGSTTEKWGGLILHFFEVTGARPQDSVTASGWACTALPAPNKVTILTDYTGLVQNYTSDPNLGDYGVQGPVSSVTHTLEPDYSGQLILNSIYATVGSSPATAPLRFSNDTNCLTVTIPQAPPTETGINLGVCGDCEVAGEPINLTNGNVYIGQRDYRLPGLGGGITLDRTWNSLWQTTPHPNVPNARM